MDPPSDLCGGRFDLERPLPTPLSDPTFAKGGRKWRDQFRVVAVVDKGCGVRVGGVGGRADTHFCSTTVDVRFGQFVLALYVILATFWTSSKEIT